MRDRLFLPDTISEALDTDLASGLRAIADALDGGHLDGRHLSTMAAAGGSHDERIHLRVSLDLAAPIVQHEADEVAERGRLESERILPTPPHDMTSREYLRLHSAFTRDAEPES